MLEAPDTGVLSGYNARGETWKQTAEEFIPPAEYWQLVDGQDHQRLVGPRGIGKTTLLRMLVSRALEHWDDSEEADRARRAIDFCGILVPARRMWNGQVAALSSVLVEEDRGRFGLAAFTYAAFSALIDTAEHRVYGQDAAYRHLPAALDRHQEAELAGQAAEVMQAPPATASLKALRAGVSANVARLGRMLRRAANPNIPKAELAEILASPLLDVDFYSAAEFFISQFNDAAGERERNWAFLLDELEFLTDEAQELISTALQGQDVRMRFKVSLAPWTRTSMQGMPFNDFTPVDLMPLRREQSDKFAERLFEQEMAKYGVDRPATDVLGVGGFEPRPDETDSYAPGGSNAEAIRQLAGIDATFKKWLDDHHMDPADLPRADKGDGDYGQVRKAAKLARLRLGYWRTGEEEGTVVPRSRKRAPELYSGTHSIWAMSEANPRWLKAFAHDLAGRWDHRGHSPAHLQAASAERVAEKYLDYFRAIDVGEPPGAPPGTSPRMTPYELVERLGLFFREQVHGPAFAPDPRTAVKVDIDGQWTLSLLNSLVFLGGLVRLADEDGMRRLRLAHMFSPHFHLPLRDSHAARLSRALAEAPREQLTFPAYDESSA